MTLGGLLLPESFPQVDGETLKRWASFPFKELAMEAMPPYVEEDIDMVAT